MKIHQMNLPLYFLLPPKSELRIALGSNDPVDEGQMTPWMRVNDPVDDRRLCISLYTLTNPTRVS